MEIRSSDGSILYEKEVVTEVENKLQVVKEEKAIVYQPKKIEKPSTEINPKKDFLLDNHSKNEEVIVENQSKALTNKYINAESLLAEIETGEKIEIPNISKKPSVKVDANVLLSSAEKEVEETFRDKVIQSINKKYNSVKTTLANRNYE